MSPSPLFRVFFFVMLRVVAASIATSAGVSTQILRLRFAPRRMTVGGVAARRMTVGGVAARRMTGGLAAQDEGGWRSCAQAEGGGLAAPDDGGWRNYAQDNG